MVVSATTTAGVEMAMMMAMKIYCCYNTFSNRDPCFGIIPSCPFRISSSVELSLCPLSSMHYSSGLLLTTDSLTCLPCSLPPPCPAYTELELISASQSQPPYLASLARDRGPECVCAAKTEMRSESVLSL